MRFSWSTTCRSVFALPLASFFNNRCFLPKNAMFSTPLMIMRSDDKHCRKNTPTMKVWRTSVRLCASPEKARPRNEFVAARNLAEAAWQSGPAPCRRGLSTESRNDLPYRTSIRHNNPNLFPIVQISVLLVSLDCSPASSAQRHSLYLISTREPGKRPFISRSRLAIGSARRFSSTTCGRGNFQKRVQRKVRIRGATVGRSPPTPLALFRERGRG